MQSSDELSESCARLGVALENLGVVVVDHGSRRAASNFALLQVVDVFRASTPYRLVEPAHMELAEPTIEQAFGRLVAAGAELVVVHPYFLLPGRHWDQDIPDLARAAAERYNVHHIVTAPLGIHRLMSTIMHHRIRDCLRHVAGEGESCDVCDPSGRCRQQWDANGSP